MKYEMFQEDETSESNTSPASNGNTNASVNETGYPGYQTRVPDEQPGIGSGDEIEESDAGSSGHNEAAVFVEVPDAENEVDDPIEAAQNERDIGVEEPDPDPVPAAESGSESGTESSASPGDLRGRPNRNRRSPRSLGIADRLTEYRALVNITAGDQELCDLLHAWGFQAERGLPAMRALIAEVEEVHLDQSFQFGGKMVNTEDFNDLATVARFNYIRFLSIAKGLFKKGGHRRQLVLDGPRPKGFGGWTLLARGFYNACLKETTFSNRLESSYIDLDRMSVYRNELQDLIDFSEARRKNTGEVELVTEKRDRLLGQLDAQISALRQALQGACLHQPDQLKKVGMRPMPTSINHIDLEDRAVFPEANERSDESDSDDSGQDDSAQIEEADSDESEDTETVANEDDENEETEETVAITVTS